MGTFCFYCWRKKIVLILISNGSAGSCFSQRRMLEETFYLRLTPFCSGQFVCLLHLLCKAAGGCGGRVDAPGALTLLLAFGTSEQQLGKRFPSLSYVRKMGPIPELCWESPVYTFSPEKLGPRVRRAGSMCLLALCWTTSKFLWVNC